jgi:hypothetical protein
MKVLIAILLFLISIGKANSQNPKDLIFVLDKKMIKKFDTLSFEITLTDSAKTVFKSVDFAKFSYIWIPYTTNLIQILPWTLQMRPGEILVYRNRNNNIAAENGKIKFIVEHLDSIDERIGLLKRALL